MIVLSGSTAFLKVTGTSPAGRYDSVTNTISLDACDPNSLFTNTPVTVTLQINDLHGNTMPAGTTIDVSAKNGTIELAPASPIPDSTACVKGDAAFPLCPAGAPALGTYGLVLTSDATQAVSSGATPYTCSNSKTSGILAITVTSPKGLATGYSFSVTD